MRIRISQRRPSLVKLNFPPPGAPGPKTELRLDPTTFDFEYRPLGTLTWLPLGNLDDLFAEYAGVVVSGAATATAKANEATAQAVIATTQAGFALDWANEAEGFQDIAEAWAEAPPNSDVPGTIGGRSALHYANIAQTAAATVTAFLTTVDFGFVADPTTETRDYGDIL